jgi:hypothetical protein
MVAVVRLVTLVVVDNRVGDPRQLSLSARMRRLSTTDGGGLAGDPATW